MIVSPLEERLQQAPGQGCSCNKRFRRVVSSY
jgi:hypothetical protein